MHPFTAYQGAKTLCIHPMWMWYTVWSLLGPQPWHHNVIRVRPYPNFSKFGPNLSQVLQCKGEPMCPFTAYQCAKTHCIHPIWMRDAVWSLLQPQPWHPSVIRVRPYPNFSKFGPHTPHRNYSVRVNPYAHSQHIKVLKLETLYTSNMDVRCSLCDHFQPQPWQPNAIRVRPYPIFSKIGP
jgi:hypothetical protein